MPPSADSYLRWLGAALGVAAVLVLLLWLGRGLVTIDRAPLDLPDSTFAGGGFDRGEPESTRPDSGAPDPALSDSVFEIGPVNPPEVEVDGAPPPAAVAAPASGLVIPVAGIAPDELFDTYSDARGRGRVHNAIDILAPRGTPVRAAAAGRILRLFTSERGGLTIYQLAPDGRTVYYYAHLDGYRPGLAAGQTVAQGEEIATVGDSGNAVPGNTHLHFAIWTVTDPAQFWDGEPVNPYPLLRGE